MQTRRITALSLSQPRRTGRRSSTMPIALALLLAAGVTAGSAQASESPTSVQAYSSKTSPSSAIEEAAVVLRLNFQVKSEKRPLLLSYIENAFPVFEADGKSKGMVYVSDDDPNRYDEVFYYRTEEAFQAGGRATSENPAWRDLLKTKREFVEGKAQVEVYRPIQPSKGSVMNIEEAAVVLHLRIRVKAANRAAFLQYIDEAFPYYMKSGNSVAVVYQSADDPESYDEVFYYRTEEAYQAGEKAVAENPVDQALLKRWRALLDAPPQVEVYRPIQR